ncbi:MAG: Lrp/AsnC ligand binding domain-containing protein [Candidatus Micrarchaeia archaeon]
MVVGNGNANSKSLMKTLSMKKGQQYSIKRDGKRFYKFYLVNPKENADPDTVAEKLISFDDVEEVYVADGDYGFIVKTRFRDGKEPKDVFGYIHNKIDSKYGEITTYYKYRK